MRASNEPNDEEDEEGGKRGEALSFSVCALTESSPRTLDENAEKSVWRRRSARVLHTAVFYSLAYVGFQIISKTLDDKSLFFPQTNHNFKGAPRVP